jgi:hypothetical protein
VWGFLAVVPGLADGQAGHVTALLWTFPRPCGPSRLTALEDTLKTGAPRFFRRSIFLAAAGILALVLTACTGRGGGYLPPDGVVFTGQAPFGFTFSCEDKGGLNPPTGKLAIELTYADLGTSLFLGAPFSIHGIVDTIKPGDEWIESAICIGQNPPPGDNVLIFLGRYRPTSSPPPGFPSTCPTRERSTSPLCRFEVEVHDNDRNLAPSQGDFFSIQLSSTTIVDDELTPGTVFYTRAGFLAGGNLTVR